MSGSNKIDERRYDPYRSVLVATFSWYGSFLFVWSGVYFGHMLAGLFLLLSYIELVDRKNFFLSGIFLGLAILTEYPSAAVLPVWLIYARREERPILSISRMIQGLVPSALFFLSFNAVVFGQPLFIAYSQVAAQTFSPMRENLGFGWRSLQALYGILFSRFRGLFFFSPVVAWLFFEYLLGLARKQNFRNMLRHPLFPLTGVYLLMDSSYYMWWGGGSYGPRHLIPITMLLLFEAVRHYDCSSKYFPALLVSGGLGTVLGFFAKTTCGYAPSEYDHDPLFQEILPRSLLGELEMTNLVSLVLGSSDLSIWFWPFAFSAYLILARLAFKSVTTRDYHHVIDVRHDGHGRP